MHLRPHIEAWSERDQRLVLKDASSDNSHAYVLDLEWCGAPAGVGEVRATVFALIGSFAESATYVRQRRVGGDAGDSPHTFAVRGRHRRTGPGRDIRTSWPRGADQRDRCP